MEKNYFSERRHIRYFQAMTKGTHATLQGDSSIHHYQNKQTILTPDPDTQGRMACGGHGHPKVSPGPAMPYSSMTLGRATPEKAGRMVGGRLLPLWTPNAERL
jgi:hypothetical protein